MDCCFFGGGGWIRTIEAKTQQIYSLPPLATRELHQIYYFEKIGAGERTRTPDLLITNQLLYQLSYTSGFLALRLKFSNLTS